MVEVGDTGKTPDPHEYVIRDWQEVDDDLFEAFVQLIRAEGYRAEYVAPYQPDYVMTNDYLEIDGWCYWFIAPRMLNRERAENRKHVPIPSRRTQSDRDRLSRTCLIVCSAPRSQTAPRSVFLGSSVIDVFPLGSLLSPRHRCRGLGTDSHDLGRALLRRNPPNAGTVDLGRQSARRASARAGRPSRTPASL